MTAGFGQIARTIIGLVLVLSSIQVLPFVSPIGVATADSAEANPDWPMFRHDMNRTGNTSSPAPNTNNILWTHQTPYTRYTWGYSGSPAVADGVAYQGGQYPDLMRAINAVTGVQIWQRPAGRISSSPTVANGHVLFGSYDQSVYSLDVGTGVVFWNRPVGDWVDSSPVVYNGKVYIGSGIGDYVALKPSRLYCLDELTGNIVWTFLAGGQIVSSPTVVDDLVIFGSYDGNVYALPVDDSNADGVIDAGEVVWTFRLGARVGSSAAAADGIVYIGGHDGNLYALPIIDPNGDRLITGDEVVWVFATGNEIWSSPGIARGRVFIASHDNFVYALPRSDPNGDRSITANEILWKFRTTDRIWGSPSIAGGKVFVGSEDYTLWALNEETGALVWNYVMPLQSNPYGSEYLYATPAIVDGRVYIGNYDLTLYCFGSNDVSLPAVTNALPAKDSENVALGTDVEVTFSEDLVPAIIANHSVMLQSSTGVASRGVATYSAATRTLIFDPGEDLLPGEHYTARLLSRYLQDPAGNALDGNGNGLTDGEPTDDFVWSFNTSSQVGHKPRLDGATVSPQQGRVATDFEFTVVYWDEDGDAPGFVRIFIDGSPTGLEMERANNTNTPDAYLLDYDYTDGELFRYRSRLAAVGGHVFYMTCSDGSNTNRTDEQVGPMILNSPPQLAIPTQYLTEDKEHTLDIASFASDVDNDVSTLTYGEDSPNCEIVTNSNLACLFEDGYVRSQTVTITANDSLNQASQDVLFIISPADDPPTFRPGVVRLPPVTVRENALHVYDLWLYITDVDTPRQMLHVEDFSRWIAAVGLSLYLVYTDPISFENVSLTVSDGTSILLLYLEVTVIPAEGTSGGTQESVAANGWLLVLGGILVAVAAFLIVENLRIWLRRRGSEGDGPQLPKESRRPPPRKRGDDG